jgi:hypothetical protein
LFGAFEKSITFAGVIYSQRTIVMEAKATPVERHLQCCSLTPTL